MASMKHVKWTRDVYEPSDDSFLLVDALQARLLRPPSPARSSDDGGGGNDGATAPSSSHWPRVAVEIGCGSGYVITSLALLLRSRRRPYRGGGGGAGEQQQGEEGGGGGGTPPPPPPPLPLLLATDVSGPALASTAETLAAHGLRAGVDVELVQGDLVEPLRGRLRGNVDLLIFNPPYVPTPDDEVVAAVLPGARAPGGGGGEGVGDGSKGLGGSLGVVAAAWAGGDRGRRVVDRLLPQLQELLSDEGEAFVVAVQENDPEGMIRAAVAGAGGAAAAAAAAQGGAEEEQRGEGGVEGGDPGVCGARWRRRAPPPPLRGEVVLRRAADEEALCVLRFWRARRGEGGAGGGGG